ncbi:MAG TPA: alginate lyase family protein [Pyrinomonadaceae bacterium]|nr:alginate lyase family protein [Pyrinomonadaceae bacterium]
MANPIDTIKKIKGRSWTEIRVRGEQVISVYSEQIGLSGNLLSDAEFAGLLDKTQFDNRDVSAENLVEKFYRNSESAFFPSFRQKEKTLESFRHNFGEKSARLFIEKADEIIEGNFDLLGYRNLNFGTPIDWHFEPLSGKRSPKKHWKQFDELSTDETGDKKIIWELNRHQHFFTLGIAFWLTKDERCAETFARHLESWMEQNPPGTGINWGSSLEVAFRAVSWIWAFHFFRGSASFTPELFRAALKFLYLHGRHIEKYLSTYYSPNTHLTGEALGLYYLGTQLRFFKQSEQWRKTGEDILFGELDRQILPDGVYFEQSTWYQRYTTDFYTHFQILRKLNGGETGIDLEEKLDKKLESLLDFLMSVTRPDGTTPFIGDDDGGRSLPHSNRSANDFRAVLSTGAVIFGRGDYKFVAKEFAEETFWLLGAEAVETFENLPAKTPDENSFAFKDGGYFVMRDGWAETDNYLLVDCGEIGALNAGHGHADALAVDLAIGGKTVLVDSGTYTYHESEEARNLFRATEAHNTLTVGGKSQSEPGGKFNWRTKARASPHRWISQDRFDFFEGSHDGYERFADAPATHTRGILFLKNDYWIMRDFVKTRGAYDYGLNFHFDAATNPAIENTKSGNLCVVEKSGAGVGSRLFTFGDNGNWRQEESRISPSFGKSVAAPFLKFTSKGAGAQEFFTFLMPRENGFTAPDVFETPLIGGRAFVIKYRDYNDVFVFSDGAQIVRTEFFTANFQFVWARLSAGEQLPEEFVLIGGSHFSTGGREIINYPQPLEFAAARRLGNRLNVRTSENIFSLSLPQKKSTGYILKNQNLDEIEE